MFGNYAVIALNQSLRNLSFEETHTFIPPTHPRNVVYVIGLRVRHRVGDTMHYADTRGKSCWPGRNYSAPDDELLM